MNRSIWFSILSIMGVVVFVAGVTLAFFSDEGTSNNNVFGAGTLDLQLSDDTTETDQDNVVASFGGTAMAPGDSVSGQLRLKNFGTIAADHAEVVITNNNSDSVNPLDRVLELTTLNYDGSSVLSQLASDPNGNGYPDLDDLEAIGLDNLALTNLGTNHPLDMTVQMRSTAGNEYQGDNVDSDWTITLNQDSTQ